MIAVSSYEWWPSCRSPRTEAMAAVCAGGRCRGAIPQPTARLPTARPRARLPSRASSRRAPPHRVCLLRKSNVSQTKSNLSRCDHRGDGPADARPTVQVMSTMYSMTTLGYRSPARCAGGGPHPLPLPLLHKLLLCLFELDGHERPEVDFSVDGLQVAGFPFLFEGSPPCRTRGRSSHRLRCRSHACPCARCGRGTGRHGW